MYIADLCKCTAAEEILLMSKCKHHVISNSTFSWWGAWLSNYNNNIVIAPRKWMNIQKDRFSNPCPNTWIQIA
jgi:hypothetical protein